MPLLGRTIKDLKGTPLELAQHRIGLYTTIPPAHHAKYRFNPNYATIVKQNIDKLLIASFIQSMEESIWLSSIIIVPKKNGKLIIYVDFIKLITTTKDPFP
jgi:hypothetical protein